jgi:hypothetical protein
MAGGKKEKRRVSWQPASITHTDSAKGSASPRRSKSSKRARRETVITAGHNSNSVTSREQSTFRGERDRRSTKGPDRGATPASATDDYVFRVKVISSTTNLDDAIFKDAVQGLVKICFPLGIMDRLGTEMVEQHMREEDAPPENIARMTELFHPELVERMTAMLAEYLDTPAKVKSCIQSIVTATSNLPTEIGDDESKDIATDPNATSPPAVRRASEHDRSFVQRTDQGAQDHEGYDLQEELVDVEETQGVRKRQASRITKKVSCTWRWDFDPDTVNEEDLPNVIKRPGDLFAFHALPIAKDLVGPNAGRKEIRNTIQAMLNDTDNATFNKWIESFHKLQNGDDTMLVRGPSERASNGRTAMTPAPTGTWTTQANPDAGHESASSEGIQHAVPQNVRIKHEGNIKSKVSGVGARREPAEVEHNTTTALATSQQSRIKETQYRENSKVDVSHRITQRTAESHNNAENAGASMMISKTPVIDVLWGASDFVEEKGKAVAVIIDRLCQRISGKAGTGVMKSKASDQSIKFQDCDGSQIVQSISQLSAILSSVNTRTMMENKLVPWVLSSLDSFVEFKKYPFVFMHILPVSTM